VNTAYMTHADIVPGQVACLPNGDMAKADAAGRIEVKETQVRWLLSEGWTTCGSTPHAEQEKSVDRQRLALMKQAMRKPITPEQATRDGIYAALAKHVPRVNLGALLKRHARA
jgi:hypothetical protein